MEDFKLIGIDSELLDRIYFHRTEDKTKYISQVEIILSKLSINRGDNRMDVINKIADADGDVDLEFLSELLAYSEDLKYSKNSDRNNYYTNCKLCEYNLEKKLEQGVTDFQSEELLFGSIMSIDLAGYAKANLIFNMGLTFAKLNLWHKANSYFDNFRNTTYELSPITVSDFYRKIAQIYIDAGEKQASLNWLKDGLLINPKLSVKKIIKKLESEL